MIENFLLQIGMRCGTLKNFNNTIIEDMRNGDDQHWYFLTPIVPTSSLSGLKECTLSLAFPFLSEETDLTEKDVFERLQSLVPNYEKNLIAHLNPILITECKIFPIPFWNNDKSAEREALSNYGQTTIHILNAKLTIKYRENWLTCSN